MIFIYIVLKTFPLGASPLLSLVRFKSKVNFSLFFVLALFKTIEWLCEQRRKSKRELFGDKRQAGSAKDQALFRARFKDNIACTTARGVGRILAVGGHFFPSKDEEEGPFM